MVIPVVSPDELQRLWDENRISQKRTEHLFSEIIAYETPAGDPALPGVRGVIIKLLTPKGQHVATVHDIVNADGSIRDSHAHDYTLRDCTRVRTIQKQEQIGGKSWQSRSTKIRPSRFTP